METLTFGDGLLIGTLSVGVVFAIWLLLTAKPPKPVKRMPMASRASVAVQPAPLQKGRDPGQLPLYEYVAGDMLAMADAVGDKLMTQQIEQVAADLEARARQGAQKYGTHLFTHNGRCMRIDAYQEALDLVQYAKGIELESNEAGNHAVAKLALMVQMHATNALLRLQDMQRALIKLDAKA
jgi:hypothetical protein